MKYVLPLLLVTALFGGCATAKIDPGYLAYLQVVSKKAQMPLVRLEAMPGEAIVGLKSLTVYAPGGGGSNIRPPTPAPPHPAWRVADRLAGILGPVVSIFAMGEFATGLATAVGTYAGHNTAIQDSYNRFDRHDVSGSYNPVLPPFPTEPDP